MVNLIQQKYIILIFNINGNTPYVVHMITFSSVKMELNRHSHLNSDWFTDSKEHKSSNRAR